MSKIIVHSNGDDRGQTETKREVGGGGNEKMPSYHFKNFIHLFTVIGENIQRTAINALYVFGCELFLPSDGSTSFCHFFYFPLLPLSSVWNNCNESGHFLATHAHTMTMTI